MNTERIAVKMRSNSTLATCLIFFLGISGFSLISEPNTFSLLAAKMLIGTFTLILIPGVYIINLLREEKVQNIGFALIFGFLFQLLNVYILWWAYIVFGSLNFISSLFLLTSLFVLALTFYGYLKHWKVESLLEIDRRLILMFVFFMIIALYYQSFSISPSSDGADYLDLARSVVQYNVFGSKDLMPPNTWLDLSWSNGMITHFFGYAGIAVFFTIGNVSLASAKSMLIFVGALSLFPIFRISERLFSRRTAIIASFLAAISPIMLTHTALVGGPEITSALFTLVTFYLLFLITEAEKPKLKLGLLAGITLFAAYFAWDLSVYLLVLVVPFLSLFHKQSSARISSKRDFLASALVAAGFLLDYRLIGSISYAYFGIPIPLTFIAVVLFLTFMKFNSAPYRLYIVPLAVSLLLVFSASWYTYMAMPHFKEFFASEYAGTGEFVSANVNATQGLFSRLLNPQLILNTLNCYLYGTTSYAWAGLYNSIGLLVWFLAFASVVRFNKIRETIIILLFPIFHILLWILFSPNLVVQPRYLVIVAPFYFILSASIIDLISTKVNDLNVELKIIKLRKVKFKISAVAALMIIAIALLSSTHLYANGIENLDIWNYKENFGWGEAISWVKENTNPTDVLIARQGNYWSWYSDRKAVHFSSDDYGEVNETGLVDWIRRFRANFLIVDRTFIGSFPNFNFLYSSPCAFYGSNIVFQSTNEEGSKVLIYNVTNISHGRLIQNEFLITNCDSTAYWSPAYGYGDGNFSVDTNDKIEGTGAVKVEFTVNQYGVTSVLFNPPASWNFSNALYLNFWIKVSLTENEPIDSIEVKFATSGSDYTTTIVLNVSINTWNEIHMPIGQSKILGNPDSSSIDFLQFYVIHDLQPGETYYIWIDNIYTTAPEYVISP